MLVYAELDPPSFIEQAKLLNEALCKAGRCPRLVQLPKHNHMSQVYAINTPDTDLSDEIVAFVKSGK
jgi:triacylglycerol lipase